MLQICRRTNSFSVLVSVSVLNVLSAQSMSWTLPRKHVVLPRTEKWQIWLRRRLHAETRSRSSVSMATGPRAFRKLVLYQHSEKKNTFCQTHDYATPMGSKLPYMLIQYSERQDEDQLQLFSFFLFIFSLQAILAFAFFESRISR